MRYCLVLVTLFLTAVDTPALADLGSQSCPSATPVVITRVLGDRRVEEAELRLTDCFGQPRKQALVELSILARPHGVDRPSRVDHSAKKLLATSVRKLDPRLLTRLQALAERWPGKRIEIVSGYRPNAKGTSRHRHGRALDLRVVGVDKEEVVAFAKGIPGTGVGYYPNSVFTHIDVREEATTWIDHSGPGQRARYGKFPENFEALLEDAEASKQAARDALHSLQTNGLGSPGTGEETAKVTNTEPTAAATSPAVASRQTTSSEESAEGPSSISEGLDTTSALARNNKAEADIVDDEIADMQRQLSKELSTIDTGIGATTNRNTVSEMKRPAPEQMASNDAPATTEKAPAKPIDWSPPW